MYRCKIVTLVCVTKFCLWVNPLFVCVKAVGIHDVSCRQLALCRNYSPSVAVSLHGVWITLHPWSDLPWAGNVYELLSTRDVSCREPALCMNYSPPVMWAAVNRHCVWITLHPWCELPWAGMVYELLSTRDVSCREPAWCMNDSLHPWCKLPWAGMVYEWLSSPVV